jgi:hypothetical protein
VYRIFTFCHAVRLVVNLVCQLSILSRCSGSSWRGKCPRCPSIIQPSPKPLPNKTMLGFCEHLQNRKYVRVRKVGNASSAFYVATAGRVGAENAPAAPPYPAHPQASAEQNMHGCTVCCAGFLELPIQRRTSKGTCDTCSVLATWQCTYKGLHMGKLRVYTWEPDWIANGKCVIIFIGYYFASSALRAQNAPAAPSFNQSPKPRSRPQNSLMFRKHTLILLLPTSHPAARGWEKGKNVYYR